MKKGLLLIFLGLTTICAGAQKNDFVISYDGIGALKLRMDKANVEKLLNMKIVLKEIGVSVVAEETVKAKYMGKDVELEFFGSNEKNATLEGVWISDPVFKLADGTGIGTERSTIIDRYENQLLILHPEWNENGPIKGTELITLANIDNIHAAMIFTMVNKKITSIKVAPTPEFRDRE